MTETDHALLRRNAANEASRRLIDELFAHVQELANEAQRGDYEARKWLCESFPGCTGLFHDAWSDDPPSRKRGPYIARSNRHPLENVRK